MAFNLMELAGSVLTPGVITKLAEHIGEKPANTQAAVDALVPSLAGIACNQASTPTGAGNLLELIAPGRLNTDFLNNPSGFFNRSGSIDTLLKTGSGLVTSLLGNKASAVARVIASVAGIQSSSASSLLNLVVTVVMGLLGREAATSRASATDLSSLLSSHSEAIRKLAPAGLAEALGVNSVADLCAAPGAKLVGAYEQRQTPPPRVVTYEEPKRRSNWMLWLLPLLALLAGIPLYRSCAGTQRDYASVALPCGTTLRVREGSFNYSLANYMVGGSGSEVPKRFVFDNLNFDSGTTRLTPESNQTVTDLAAIMKCFPNMQVKLEGHTDNTGDAAANRKLSLDRAEKVKELLVQGGITAPRIATEGLGQDRPVAPNDNEVGRAKNRRTELEVTAR